MHRPVAYVFKILGISIIMMIVMTLSYIAVDTLTVYNRVQSLSVVMQDELSRNNCIPNGIKDLFESELQKIVSNSNVAKEIRTNIATPLTVDGEVYEKLEESNVKDYGELLTLVIEIDMEPDILTFVHGNTAEDGSLMRRSTFSYTMNFKYTVPALRYLK